jgi:uncharacterized YccA/Bax inhibitor family protein
LLRIIAGLAALLFAAYPLLILWHQIQSGFEWFGVLLGSPFGTASVLCWWFALRGQFADSRAIMNYSVLGGLILGGISFVAGFVGPIMFTPNANQGPLLGIFFTGPLGFVVGVILGTIVGFVRRSS